MFLELCDVAPQAGSIDAQLFFTPTHDDAGAKDPAERVDCLAERVARVGLIEIRPEQREDRVPPVDAARARRGRGRSERAALRPALHRGDVATAAQYIARSARLDI